MAFGAMRLDSHSGRVREVHGGWPARVILVFVGYRWRCPRCRRTHFDPCSALRAKIGIAGTGSVRRSGLFTRVEPVASGRVDAGTFRYSRRPCQLNRPCSRRVRSSGSARLPATDL
jgi:hypothetical protein